MKIHEIKIDSFGKFQSKKLVFKKGLNVVFGKNEDGKSTLLNLIIYLLYDINMREMKRYIPWNKDSFGISNSIKILLDNEKEILIEKNLNKKETKIFSLNPLKEITSSFAINKNKINVMEDLTGLSLNSFESSALIKQSETKIESNEKSKLAQKLLRISKYGHEDIDYSNAVKKLDKRKDEIGTGSAGKHKELIKINNELEKLNEEYNLAVENINRINELQVKLSKLKIELNTFYNEKQNVDKLLRYNNKQLTEKYYSIEQELIDKRTEITKTSDRIKNIYEEFRIDQLDIKKIQLELNLINNLEERLEELINKKLRILDKIEQIKEEDSITGNTKMYDIKKSMLNDRLKSVKRYLTVVISAGSVATIIAAVFGLFYGSYNLLWYLMLAFIPLTIFFITYYRKSINNLIKVYEYEYERIDSKTKITSDKEKLQIILEDIENEIKYIQEKLLRKKTNNLSQLKDIGIYTESYDFKILLINIVDSNRNLQELKGALEVLKSEEAILANSIEAYKKSIKIQARETKEIEEVKKEIKEEEIPVNINLEEIEDKNKTIMENTKKLEIEVNTVEKEIEILSNNYTHPGDIQNQIEILNQKRKELEDEKECIQIAKNYLESSFDEMQNSIIPILNNYSLEVLNNVMGSTLNNVSTDTELNMLMSNSTKSYIDIENLSYSTVEQLYLALRIALTKVLSEGESIPLFLDESFAYYDDLRLENTMKYLSDIAYDFQIILFTCQNRDVKVLKSLYKDFNYISLSNE